ncbi:carboxypeptidase-like regulatory domain-containing protein [Alloacidobacterium sp.]|uniref:TonB-dependent receptor n=1 Tax=Alloacidobacterium sp. TaxID=2951999 RepID=UPI002D4206EA|nr:carboxypeptidase-like regulatory domain-containing protein [Alloacidobacterium sp.]HYK37502.1 carboxypeptidase-like regulatory domain-containing protein [Alloacidobacterium sp.]
MSFASGRLSAILLCVLVLSCFSAEAQVSANLSGKVTDPAGAAVPAASVTANNLDTRISRTTLTDQTGEYQLFELPVGRYEVRARKDGFAEKVREGIFLVVGQDATADLSLQVGEVKQQVTVVENVPVVNVTSQDISGLVGEQQVKELPLNGRSYDLLLTLNPGIVNFTSQKTGGIGVSNSTTGNNFAVSGNRPQQNLFLLNGVEFTGAAENNMQPGGPSQQLLGVEAVREFNVLRDSYGAEYGKRPGAQVIIVTQSGTNQLHGSAYEFLRNNVLDAPNYFDQGSAPPFQRNQFGGSLGGPLHKDKTFLFANYEGYRQNLHQTSAAFVPDLASRAKAVDSVKPLLNLWPTPPADAPDFNGIAQVFSNPLQTIREDFGTARLDQTFSPKDTLAGTYTIDDGADYTETTANPYSTDILTLREQVLSLDETHIFSPALLNLARVGYSRAAYFFTGEPTPGTPAASVAGFITGRPVGAVVVGGSAASNPQAQIGLAGSNNGSNLPIVRNLFTYEDRVTLSHGRHQMSLGAWFQQFQSNETINLSQYGQATFTSLQTFLQGTTSSFLYSPAPTEMNWRSLFGAVYAQDVIRLSPKLTATLGFRGEFSTGWNEAHGRAANYTFTDRVISSQPHVGDNAFTTNNAKFLPEPRIGLAWSPRLDKTVVRAGFGIYNELLDDLGYRMDQNAPFNPTYSIASLPVSSLPLNPQAPTPAKALLVPGGVQPDAKMPTLISYSLRVEQELTPNTSLTVGYVGSHGYHQLIGVDGNQPVPTICPASPCPGAYPANFPNGLANTAVPSGAFYIPAGTPKANTTLANTWTWFSWGNSNYNSLQVDVNHRFSHDLSLRGVYTWSKALDNGDSLNATAAGNAPGLVSNPYDLHADWGLATYDVRNIGVISAVYILPFGRNKAFVNNLTGFANALVNGWSVNSIVTVQSGFPFTPQLSYNPSNNGDTRNPVRPFANPNFHGSAIFGKPSQWFNPEAFLQPPANSGFYGNLGRDTLIGPGLGTWDFSAGKDTAIHERLTLQFRAEMFNLLNRANFNTPNLIVFTPSGLSGTAGAITSTSTTSRQVQFAVKLLW